MNELQIVIFVRLFINVNLYKVKNLLFSLIMVFFAGSFITAQSLTREVGATGQKSEDGVIVVSPNPARDFVIIKSKDNSLKIKSVTIYSILGMQVAEYAVNMNSGEIRLDKLRPGKYLMKYTLSDNTQQVTQIIKQQ